MAMVRKRSCLGSNVMVTAVGTSSDSPIHPRVGGSSSAEVFAIARVCICVYPNALARVLLFVHVKLVTLHPNVMQNASVATESIILQIPTVSVGERVNSLNTDLTSFSFLVIIQQ